MTSENEKMEHELTKAGLEDYLETHICLDKNFPTIREDVTVREYLLAGNSYCENYSDEYGKYAIDFRFESNFPSFIYVFSEWKQVC